MPFARMGQEWLSMAESCATYHSVDRLVVQPVHCCIISTLNQYTDVRLLNHRIQMSLQHQAV